jgi:putative SOS response-associated peptidase YedK
VCRIKRDLMGNFPGLPAIYPDTMAPVVRTASDGERELTMMRWGFPPPPSLGNGHQCPQRYVALLARLA